MFLFLLLQIAEENPVVTVGVFAIIISFIIGIVKSKGPEIAFNFISDGIKLILSKTYKQVSTMEINDFNVGFMQWLPDNKARVIFYREKNNATFIDEDYDYYEHENVDHIMKNNLKIDPNLYSTNSPRRKNRIFMNSEPAHGTQCVFWYNKKLWIISYDSPMGPPYGGQQNTKNTEVTITGLFVDSYEIERLVQEICSYVEEDSIDADENEENQYYSEFTACYPSPAFNDWEQRRIPSKPQGSVILPQKTVDRIFSEIDSFRKKRMKYRLTGVPYRKGILLYGQPGNGKTSLVSMIAARYGLIVYSIPIGANRLDDKALEDLVGRARGDSIILLEDVDAARFATSDRNTNDDARSQSNQGVTLSGLLNVLDGLSSKEGVIFIMTTNFPEKLDAAILREGRTDLKIYLENADKEQIFRMFSKFFPVDEEDISLEESERRLRCALEFAEIVPEKAQSMAAIQAFLIEYWYDCEEAVKAAKERIEENGQIADAIEVFKVTANFKNKLNKNGASAQKESIPPNTMDIVNAMMTQFGGTKEYIAPASENESEEEDEDGENYDETYE
jgi:hypothetical protein